MKRALTSTDNPVERHQGRTAADRRRVTGGVVSRKTRMLEIITQWAVFVSCLMPWGIIFAWLASRFVGE